MTLQLKSHQTAQYLEADWIMFAEKNTESASKQKLLLQELNA